MSFVASPPAKPVCGCHTVQRFGFSTVDFFLPEGYPYADISGVEYHAANFSRQAIKKEGQEMKKVKQISVALQNKPGTLALACQCMAEEKVNILAISVAETSEMCIVRLVVDKTALVQRRLKECGMVSWSVEDVLLVSLSNKPGALAKVAAKLAAAKVNINYIYGTTGKAGTRSSVVLGVSSIARAAKALGRK